MLGQNRIVSNETQALVACVRCGKPARVKCASKKGAATLSGSLELMCMPAGISWSQVVSVTADVRYRI